MKAAHGSGPINKACETAVATLPSLGIQNNVPVGIFIIAVALIQFNQSLSEATVCFGYHYIFLIYPIYIITKPVNR